LTVIETVIGTFRQAGISDITVVLGHRADDLKPLLERAHVRWVINDKFNEGMFSSIIAGLRSLRPGIRGVFLLPADIPLVKKATIEKIASEQRNFGDLIFYPTYMKQRGHPPLIPSRLFPEILSWNGQGGLQSLLELHEKEAHEVEAQDEGILLDIDTPEDYRNVCSLYERR